VRNLWTCERSLRLRCGHTLGHPTCGHALCCIGAPNLGEAILKSLPPSQNLFSSILQLVFKPSAPLCGRFRCGCVLCLGRPSCGCALRCVGVPNLRTCGRALCLHCGRALVRPTCRRALRCVGAPNLWTCLVLRLGAHLANVPCVVLGRPTLLRLY
jgi:hypothetical protein